MRKSFVFLLGTVAVAAVIARSTARPAAAPSAGVPAPRASRLAPRASSDKAVIEQYCLECHDADHAKGDLVLETFDPAKADQRAEISEKIVRKLRAGMMPPAGHERPPDGGARRLATSLETKLDAAAEARPNPGRRTFQRLNRAEYTAVDPRHAVARHRRRVVPAARHHQPQLRQHRRRAVDVGDAARGLPARRVAGEPPRGRRSRGDARTRRSTRFRGMASQLAHVDGAPFGTRGGISVVHNFPADGEYTFRMMLHSIPTGQLYGSTVARRADRSLGQRPARRGDRDQPAHERVGRERDEPADAADRRQGGPAARLRRVPPAIRGAGGRPARAGRADARRHADRQLDRRHDAPAPPRVRGRRAAARDGRVGHAEPPPRLHLPAALAGRGARRARRASSPTLADEGLSPPGHRRGRRRPDEVLHERARDRRLRGGHPHRAPGDAREPALHLPPRGSAGGGARGPDLQAQRPRPRVAAVVLHLGQRSGRRVDRGRDAGARSARRRGSSSRRAACSPIRAPSALSTRFASQWLRLQDLDKIHPDARLYPQFDSTLADAMVTRDRAPLRQHRPRGPRRARSADRRLHLRERAARAALRHPERQRPGLPASVAQVDREPPRPPRARAAS